MKQRFLNFLMPAVLLLSGSVLLAQDTPPVNAKLGFVNTLAVLQQTQEGQREIAALEQYVNQRRSELDTQSQELMSLQRQYTEQATVLNPDTRNEMQQTIEEKERQVKRLQEDIELELNRRRNLMLNRMSEKIQIVIAEYAQQNNFGAVFLQDPSQPYVAPALDITQQVIEIYDQKNPVAGQQTSSQAPAPGGGAQAPATPPPSSDAPTTPPTP